MGGEWRKTKLGHLLTFTNGKASPRRSDDLPFPVYGSNGIIGYAYRLRGYILILDWSYGMDQSVEPKRLNSLDEGVRRFGTCPTNRV